MTSSLPVAALASRKAASTASAPPENIWMRRRPSGGMAALALDDLPGPRSRLAQIAHHAPLPKRTERYAAMAEEAYSRKRAKLGHALRSMSTISPEGVTMQSPP